ncbi:unnamed protein product [Boreogadus saida]
MTAVVFFVLLLSLVSGSHAWRCVEGPILHRATQIDASKGQVVASNIYNQNFFLNGGYWNYLHGARMKHITTGDTGTWGVGTNNQLYKMIGGNFTSVPGFSLSQVDAGGDGFLVGSTGSRAYCLRTAYARVFKGAGSVSWSALPGYTLKYYSCGLLGCWGVDTIGRVYHTKALRTSEGGSHLKQGSRSAIFMVIIEDRVPSSARLFLVLFSPTTENTNLVSQESVK